MSPIDPITVEVIGAAMASIVEETGETLIRASHSTNNWRVPSRWCNKPRSECGIVSVFAFLKN